MSAITTHAVEQLLAQQDKAGSTGAIRGMQSNSCWLFDQRHARLKQPLMPAADKCFTNPTVHS